MLGSFHQASEFFEIIFNKDKFESLPKEHQAILEYTAEAAGTANYALAMDRYSQDLEELITKDGVSVHRTPQSVMEEQLKAWDSVLSELMLEIIFNKDKFESLPKEHQAILEYTAEAAGTANYALAMDRYSQDLEELITKDGVSVHRTPQSVMEEQLKAWDSVLSELMKEPFFRKVVESQKAWARRVAFYDLLNAADYRLAYKHYFPNRIDF